jgi:TonB family protein
MPVAVGPLSMPAPVYPVDVLEQGVNGRVVMIVDVAMDGSVSAIKVDRSAGDQRLDAAALEAVGKWKFKPLVKDGKPVPSQVRVPVEFEMDGDHAVPLEQARAGVAVQAAGRVANASDWSSYDRMVRSLSASWETPAAPADAC